MKSPVYWTLVITVMLNVAAGGYPEPAVVQGPDNWTAEVRFEHPQQIILQQGTGAGAKFFWYLIITVMNRTGRDIDFYPVCELVTDKFEVLSAGTGTTPQVFDLIKRRHQSRYPLLEPLEQTDNRILEGEDNAKDIAIIWPDCSRDATGFKIFISGLSNETAVVEHPITHRPVYLRKTLELEYRLRGDPAVRSSLRCDYIGKRWVMR